MLERRNVLPGQYHDDLKQSLDKSNIGSRMLFGLYTAELTTSYGAE